MSLAMYAAPFDNNSNNSNSNMNNTMNSNTINSNIIKKDNQIIKHKKGIMKITTSKKSIRF